MNEPSVLLIHVQRRTRIKFNLSGIYPIFPLGIAYLGAVLEGMDILVRLLDLNLPEHRWFNPSQDITSGTRFVGLSATLFSVREAVVLSRDIKRIKPDVPVVLGGPATIFDPDVLARRFPDVDVFVFEEGETAVKLLAQSDFSARGLSCIPGIAYRDGGHIVTTTRNGYVDLDSLPYPARHLLPDRRYGIHPPFGIFPPVTVMETARGCPYPCIFCSLPKVLRQRSAPHIIGEIKKVVSEEGIREIHFVDPTFTAEHDHVEELCEALKASHIDLAWSFKTRPDLVTASLLRVCREAGCHMISYGIESFSDRALDHLNKGHTGEEALHALRETEKAGIRSLVYMLVGNPGDTDESVKRTVRTLRRTGCDYALFSGLIPDPKAPMIEQAYQAGRLSPDSIENFYFHGKPLPDGYNLAGFSSHQISSWMASSFVRFYFHPAFILRRAISAHGWRELRLLLVGFWNLIKDLFGWTKTVSPRGGTTTSF